MTMLNHEFEDNYKMWFNSYRVIEMVNLTYEGAIFEAAAPISPFAKDLVECTCFLIVYHGIRLDYVGRMVSDGNRFAYVVDKRATLDLIEGARPNLYCRTLIRNAIKEYLNKMEVWPES